MAKWRPEGFYERIKASDGIITTIAQGQVCFRLGAIDFSTAVEIIADAMLNSLRARGLHCDFKEWAFGEVPYIAQDFGMGTQVFIPDDPLEGQPQ